MYKNCDELPVMLSVAQAAETLGISTVSLYKLIKKITPSLLLKWVEERLFRKNILKIGLIQKYLRNWLDIKQIMW